MEWMKNRFGTQIAWMKNRFGGQNGVDEKLDGKVCGKCEFPITH
jgi:hypothetical protein